MSRNIDDISSIFWVLGHPDTIFENENCLLENRKKSLNITDISVIYRYIRHKSETKMQDWEKI